MNLKMSDNEAKQLLDRLDEQAQAQPDLQHIRARLAEGLKLARVRPMLTADELDVVIGILQKWQGSMAGIAPALDYRMVQAALPKLQAMQAKAVERGGN